MNAPVSVVFAHITDHRTWPILVPGVKKFVVVSDNDTGAGAVFEGAITIGPMTVRGRLRITGWEQDHLIVAETESAKGSTSVTAVFTALTPEETQLDISADYELPGGVVGHAVERLVLPVVHASIGRAERTFRAQLDGVWPGRHTQAIRTEQHTPDRVPRPGSPDATH